MKRKIKERDKAKIYCYCKVGTGLKKITILLLQNWNLDRENHIIASFVFLIK